MKEIDPIKLKIGLRIDAGMKAKGLDQTSLSKLFSKPITPQAIQQWIAGVTSPTQKRLIELSKILDRSIPWLLAEVDNESGYIDSHVIRKAPPLGDASFEIYGGFEDWDESTPLSDDEVALNYFREIELSAGSGRAQVIENHGVKLRFKKAAIRILLCLPGETC